MATIPLNPANQTGAQVVDSMALQPPATSGQPDSLVGTMVPAPSYNVQGPKTVAPSVVTSTPARQQTQSNKQQLDNMVNQLKVAQMALDNKRAQDAATAAEAAKTKPDAASTAIQEATGAPTLPQKSAEQLQAEQDVRDTMSRMDELMVRMDGNASALIASIQSEYAALQRQQEETNRAYEAGIRTEGYRSDRARYAPLLQGQIIKGAIDGGLQKIADLNMKKNRLIIEAQNARDEKSFAALNSKMSLYRDIVKEERAVAQQTYENAMNASKAARDQLKFEMDVSEFDMKQSELIGEGIAGDYSNIKATQGQEAADIYLNKVATNMNLPSAYLMSNVQKTLQDRGAKQQTAVLDLAKNYPSAGIKSTDTIEEAAARVRESAEYKQDFYKGELAISNTSSLINQRKASESIDYSNPIFQIYSDSSGQLISSPTTAKAVLGYADSLMAGKDVVPDGTKNLKDGQITETEAYNLIKNSFTNFRTKAAITQDVNAWLSSPEAIAMEDTEKAGFLRSTFGVNPEDFNVWE